MPKLRKNPILNNNDVFHPGRAIVHPLFDPTKFDPTIDWNGGFYDAAVLASRLLQTPQVLQHDYCLYYGVNEPAALPKAVKSSSGAFELPVQYSSDKAVGELSQGDIDGVNKQRFLLAGRVRFEVGDLPSHVLAECRPVPSPNSRTKGCDSSISIDRKLYNAVLNKNRTPEDMAMVNLQMASVLLHELAHAATNHRLGQKCEDFCEESLVAEAGFELEHRIRGMVFAAVLDDLSRSFWWTWQARDLKYDLSELCRDELKLPQKSAQMKMDPAFAMKLFDDEFWEGEYVERGAVSLVPDVVAKIILGEARGKAWKGIPNSIKDLFRSGGPSYAKRRYSRSSNPDRKLRGIPTSDYRCADGTFETLK